MYEMKNIKVLIWSCSHKHTNSRIIIMSLCSVSEVKRTSSLHRVFVGGARNKKKHSSDHVASRREPQTSWIFMMSMDETNAEEQHWRRSKHDADDRRALILALCEYSKFWIESNSYFSSRFDSKWKKHYSHSTSWYVPGLRWYRSMKSG